MVDELLLTVDIELEVTGALHVDHIFASLLRGEGGLVFGGEVLDGQVGCKDMHTCCGDIDGLRVVFGGEGLALHHLVVGQVATGEINEILLLGLKTLEDCDGLVGRTIVVTPHHRLVVGVRTDYCDLLLSFLQGEDVVLVLQQDDSLTGHLEGHLGRSLGGHGRIRDLRPLYQ